MAFKLDYYNITHKGLSYSRELTLENCPRKYELDAKFAIKANRSSVTFSYGHSVAAGVQFALAGHSMERCIVETMLAYTHDVNDVGTENEQSQKKSIWWAMLNVEEFYRKYKAGVYKFLDGWEVAKITKSDGTVVPAIELTFVIELLDGYTFEGHIDLVLYHPVKKRFMVLELKTTGMTTVDEAQYKNSTQALGYGAVIDLMADQMGEAASFDVLYMVYQSRNRQIIPMPFTKTAKDRVDWLTKLVINMKQLEMYEDLGYPKRGQSCFNFFRPCEYIKTCSLSNTTIASMFKVADGTTDDESYTKLSTPDFMFTLDELLTRQDQLVAQIESGKVSDTTDAELLISTTLID